MILNLNCLRDKLDNLKLFMEDINRHYLVISEIKLDEIFPNANIN